MMKPTTTMRLRVDDRLLHGQVVVTWVRDLAIKIIWIISDRVASEPIEIALLQSAVPFDVKLEIFTIHEAADEIHKPSTAQSIMVMVENLQTVLDLQELGFPLPDVNVGGLRYQPGKVALHRAVYVGKHDVDIVNCLERQGVVMTLQVVPSDYRINFYDRLRKKWK